MMKITKEFIEKQKARACYYAVEKLRADAEKAEQIKRTISELVLSAPTSTIETGKMHYLFPEFDEYEIAFGTESDKFLVEEGPHLRICNEQ